MERFREGNEDAYLAPLQKSVFNLFWRKCRIYLKRHRKTKHVTLFFVFVFTYFDNDFTGFLEWTPFLGGNWIKKRFFIVIKNLIKKGHDFVIQIIWCGYTTFLTTWLEFHKKLKDVWQSLTYAYDKTNNQRMHEHLKASSTFWGPFIAEALEDTYLWFSLTSSASKNKTIWLVLNS